MAIKLYGHVRSPCVRSVLLTAKVLGIHLEFIIIDVSNHENLTPGFLKINPQHTIPTIDDNGFILWDSHTIMCYLVDKYGKDSTLYPKDLKKRANVNRLLYFDAGELFAMHLQICMGTMMKGNKEISAEPLERLKKNFADLEKFLQNTKFVAGDDMTIADFSIWTTISNAQNWIPLVEDKYPNIVAWKKVMDSLSYANLNLEGANLFKEKVSKVLA